MQLSRTSQFADLARITARIAGDRLGAAARMTVRAAWKKVGLQDRLQPVTDAKRAASLFRTPNRRARIAAVYCDAMSEEQDFPRPPPAPSTSSGEDRAAWPVWSGRVGDPEPKADYSSLTPSERVELCWEVTKQAWALSGALLDESAFCRDSASVSRRGR